MLSFINRFIYVLIGALILFVNVDAGQCQAITKKGSQCKRQAAAGSSYCWQHKGNEATTTQKSDPTTTQPGIKKDNSKKERTVSTQCQATTKKGKQCSRKAKAGSQFCWQHGG